MLMGEQGQGWGRIQAEGTAEQMSVGGNVECSRHVRGTASGLLGPRTVCSVQGSCPRRDRSVPSSAVGEEQGPVTALSSGK